ncbi:MAG: DUF2927 domain-containing protein [Planctomycetota bacterium]
MRSRSLLAIPLVWLLAACAAGVPIDRAVEQQWATDVLLGAESGHRRDGVVRWRGPVRFLVVEAKDRFRRAIDRAFEDLSRTLEGVHRLELEYVQRRDTRIGGEGFVTVFPVAPGQAALLAAELGALPPSADADGWFTIAWNGAFELTRALVFVDPALEPRWLRHTALEEMFQSLGPSNDSGLLRDSLVYEGEHGYGSHQRLARVDREILRLLYGALLPGADAAEIARAMARSWRFDGG